MLRFSLVILLCSATAYAQQWTAPVRGSWVQQGAAQAGDVDLSNCQIVVGTGEHSAVKQAASFLAGDIERLCGHRPAIVESPPMGAVTIRLVTVGSTDTSVPGILQSQQLRSLWEAHRIRTDSNAVWLVGSNFRGTAFAAYTLSERLGIDPLYHWTGYVPARRDKLILKQTDYYAPPPTVRFRGLFHDDEDILPRPLGDNGIPSMSGTVPLEWYQRYFETALRLRMNQVAPFVRVQRPFEVQKMASDWGLYYTSHHYDILLSNPFGFDRFGLAKARGVSGNYDYVLNKEGVLAFWKGGVIENRELDCIWPVGLRGTEDRPFQFPANTTQPQKDQAFSEAIATQVKMTRELLPPGKEPLFHFTMYNEMLKAFQDGNLQVPADVMLIWNDNGDGMMRALPKEPGRWKHGVYYHLAFYGGSLTKQAHHTVTPMRIEGEFRKIVAAGATEYLLVNVSELREFVMEARFLAEICWDAKTAFAKDDGAGRFVDWWSHEYFGDKAAPKAADAYRRYYGLINAPADLWIGSTAVATAVDALEKKLTGQPSTPADSGARAMLVARRDKYKQALAVIQQAKQDMTEEQSRYFFEHCELGLLMDFRPTEAAVLLMDAVNEPDRTKALALCHQAMGPLEQLEREMSQAERPPFDRWYGPTWIRQPFSRFSPHWAYNCVSKLLKP